MIRQNIDELVYRVYKVWHELFHFILMDLSKERISGSFYL